VFTSCVSGIIGEDIDGIIKRVQGEVSVKSLEERFQVPYTQKIMPVGFDKRRITGKGLEIIVISFLLLCILRGKHRS
jgi:nitrogenase molybdenum-iron protein alpha/beta subunit